MKRPCGWGKDSGVKGHAADNVFSDYFSPYTIPRVASLSDHVVAQSAVVRVATPMQMVLVFAVAVATIYETLVAAWFVPVCPENVSRLP